MRRDTILGIDPGTTISGVLVLKARAPGEEKPQVIAAGDMANEDLLEILRLGAAFPSDFKVCNQLGLIEWGTVAIEQFKALATGGKSVIALGQSSVITIQWTGRFQEAAEWGMREGVAERDWRDPVDVRLVIRADVVKAHGISAREKGKDALLQDACCRVFVTDEQVAAAEEAILDRVYKAAKKRGVDPERPKDIARKSLRRAAVGLKASPGPLFGISGHSWQAFALGLVVEKADMGEYGS
jgi:hypothetical protein